MIIAFFILICLMCFSGFILFAKLYIDSSGTLEKEYKVSVIVPARNEEKNLPNILISLKKQTYKPYEIIVVDDFSTDRTSEIAQEYGVTLIHNTKLPENWTGKTWAVWNGYLKSSGDILFFLDADVRLAPTAIETLLKARERSGGAISVVPYHYMERFYEKLSLIVYLLGIFAFTSRFEKNNPQKGLYGSCIVTTREDYVKINGHESIKAELLDDLNLGKKFIEAGISVENFIGGKLVSFRMYPNGIKSEMQGFGKGAVLSTAKLSPKTIINIAFWIVGLLIVELVTPFIVAINHIWGIYFLMGYLIYTLQIFYFIKNTGRYGIIMPVLHFISSIFFIIIMVYSAAQVIFKGSVSWKGRQIKIGGKTNL